MSDKYIETQRRIIRKRIMKTLPGYATSLLLALVVFLVVLFGTEPPPGMWKSDEITIVDIQYRGRPRSLARYTTPGYEVTDQNGNLYWSGTELTWEEIGETYTIKYYDRGAYRRLRAVSQGDRVIISEAERIALWKQDFPFFILMQLASLSFILYLLRCMYRDFQHPEIRACRERIRLREQKLHRR